MKKNLSSEIDTHEEEKLMIELLKLLKAELNHKDFANAELILPSLVRFFRMRYNPEAYESPVIIFDVGANVGETSSNLVNLFTPIDCIRIRQEFENRETAKHCVPNAAKIIAIEPATLNMRILRNVSRAAYWNYVGWESMLVAVSSNSDGNGNYSSFYGSDRIGDQQGSLNVRVANVGPMDNRVTYTVKLLSIDRILKDRGFDALPNGTHAVLDLNYYNRIDNSSPFHNNGRLVYLLKIDAEGYDGLVLQGAENALRLQRIKWIIFEYNRKWDISKISLGNLTIWLDKLSYECFYIVPSAGLIPFYFNNVWNPRFDVRRWSNILCGRKADRDVTSLILQLGEVTKTAMRSYMSQRWVAEVKRLAADDPRQAA